MLNDKKRPADISDSAEKQRWLVHLKCLISVANAKSGKISTLCNSR
ncbi:hypothetical protein [Nostoc sp. DSM 114160]